MASTVFSTRLRALRQKRGLTVTALASMAGMNRVSLHKLEAGVYAPSLESAQKLAFALGVDLSAFLESENSQKNTRST